MIQQLWRFDKPGQPSIWKTCNILEVNRMIDKGYTPKLCR
jgi:hypothetical protein